MGLMVESVRSQVRVAVVQRDVQGLVDLLVQGGWPEHTLQWIGDGLIDALAADAAGARDLARRCVEELRGRDWIGDAELADTLEARLGNGPWPMLRPLPVDLEELSSILEGDPAHNGGRIDLTSGEVWPRAAIEYAEETGELDPEEEDDRWLPVWCQGSRDGYRDMEAFIALLDDEGLASRLERAIAGRGAFRRFKDVLWDLLEPLDSWHAFSDERSRGRARAWLADEGYTPVPAS